MSDRYRLPYPPRAFLGPALAALALLCLLAPAGAQQAGGEGEALLERHCAACHRPRDDGAGLSRISQVRKTPEGWDTLPDAPPAH